MAPSSQAPRRAALKLLSSVIGDGVSVQEAAVVALLGLPPEDRARAQRLSVDVLRKLGRLDHVLKPYLRKPPPLFVENALRLASLEMLDQGAAAHGVVNDAVSLVREGQKSAPMAGLVNAVLRKVAAEGATRWAEAAPQRLPKWLRGRLLKAYGEARVLAMEAMHEVGAPLDLTLKAARPDGLEARVLPQGSLRMTAQGQVTALPGYASGDWWVQDAAAACPVQLLDPQVGERVLDLCAAPGGKTMQIAAAGAKVTALDSAADRMVRLEENLARVGLKADCVIGDALTHAAPAYDAILLDAPCSATGTIRRHPDLPFIKDGKGLRDLYALQTAMLDHAVTLLKPGGRMMFCTCSLLREEGEYQVTAALDRHEGLEVMPLDAAWIEDNLRSPEGGLRLTPEMWPEQGGLDGFYMALFRKAG